MKIAFFVQWMICGGVENALITLSNELNKAGHNVTIYVVQETGDFMQRIPNGVQHKKIPLPGHIDRILPLGGTKIAVQKQLEKHHYFIAAKMLVRHVLGRSGFAELNVDFDEIPMISEFYDVAVNFHMHSPFLIRYLAEKVKASRKLTWIHNDFTTTGYSIKKLQPYLELCDGFYGVSQILVKEFTDIFPEYASKTKVIYNIIPIENILNNSEGTVPEFEYVDSEELILLSVGRLEKQKGYDITIEVAKMLKDSGIRFQWFILGEGTERARLENLVHKNKLQQRIHFIGIRMNPYPYFKNCDIYVQTSRHEGFVTTVTEANLFHKPIVCTDVSGAREQITDGKNGYVADFSAQAVSDCLIKIIKEDFKVDTNSAANFDAIIKANLEIFME